MGLLPPQISADTVRGVAVYATVLQQQPQFQVLSGLYQLCCVSFLGKFTFTKLSLPPTFIYFSVCYGVNGFQLQGGCCFHHRGLTAGVAPPQPFGGYI